MIITINFSCVNTLLCIIVWHGCFRCTYEHHLIPWVLCKFSQPVRLKRNTNYTNLFYLVIHFGIYVSLYMSLFNHISVYFRYQWAHGIVNISSNKFAIPGLTWKSWSREKHVLIIQSYRDQISYFGIGMLVYKQYLYKWEDLKKFRMVIIWIKRS